jgi:hypothetical protein
MESIIILKQKGTAAYQFFTSLPTSLGSFANSKHKEQINIFSLLSSRRNRFDAIIQTFTMLQNIPGISYSLVIIICEL